MSAPEPQSARPRALRWYQFSPVALRLMRAVPRVVVGAALSGFCGVLVVVLTPSDAIDWEYSFSLALTLSPIVGLWAGWLRRSWLWSAGGLALGLALGACYRLMYLQYYFTHIVIADSGPMGMVGQMYEGLVINLPCLYVGIGAVVLGRSGPSWHKGILGRFCKGAVAGFVFGTVFHIVLAALGLPDYTSLMADPSEGRRRLIVHAVPIAMAVAGGIFLMLFEWASNLTDLSQKRH
jgi:hypothetical protein